MNSDITYIGVDELSNDSTSTVKTDQFKTTKHNRKISRFINSTKPNIINKKIILFLLILILLYFYNPIVFLREKLDEKRELYNNSQSVEYNLNLLDSFIYLFGYNYYKNCNNTMMMPAKGIISYQFDLSHQGIDIVCDEYQGDIYAAENGYIRYVGYSEKYGNELLIEHNINGIQLFSFYGNLSSIHVNDGQYVSKGQVIAQEGGQNMSKTELFNPSCHHLHFEVRKSEKPNTGLNPNIIIK